MFTITTQDDGTNYLSEIRSIDQPNWPIKEFLDFRDSIAHLPQGDLTQRSRPRTRLAVAPDGTPLLEFLDQAGNVTDRYPPS